MHGGGFYHNEKYLTGPVGEPLSNHLHWFYWEAYSTWLSGMAMLAIVYWAGASTFLIDKSVMDLTPAAAIAISIGSIVLGWFIYDALCRIFEKNEFALWTSIGIFLLIFDWGFFHIFGARAAFIHVGAVIGTIMVWNVFFIIIPGQRKVVRAAARRRSARYAAGLPRQAALGAEHLLHAARAVHHDQQSLSDDLQRAVRVARAGRALDRGRAGAPLLRAHALQEDRRRAAGRGAGAHRGHRVRSIAPHAPAAAVGGPAVSYAQIAPIVAQRCAVCHAAHPTQAGFSAPPAGILLDTPEHIVANAALIRTRSGRDAQRCRWGTSPT